jgi:hypothetical protein
MSPQEFWAIADARKPVEKIGPFTKDEFADMVEQLQAGSKKA